MRGQAEVISTIILVSIAIVIALGLVYYLGPGVARSGAEYRLSSLLSSYAASLEFTGLSSINTSNGVIEVFELVNSGSTPFRVYAGVMAFLNTSLPAEVNTSYMFYIMVNGSATVSAGGGSGWRLLPLLSIEPRHVYVYLRNGYYSLADLGWNKGLKLFDAGLLNVSRPVALKLDLNITQPGLVYVVSLFARVSNNFYEIMRYTVYQP